MTFTKMQGIGNDYIYLYNCHKSKSDLSQLSIKLSHRRYGIGADGLVVINPIQNEQAQWQMLIFNADGSLAETCGNALRCVGKYLWDRSLASLGTIYISTLAGIAKLEPQQSTLPVKNVNVYMNIPSFSANLVVNNNLTKEVIEEPLQFEGIEKPLLASFVSMGNPHTIIFVTNLGSYPVEKQGPIIENASFFRQRTNIAFVEKIDEHTIKQRTWERGSAETWACGSAACAAVALGIYTKKLTSPVKVSLSGGELQITWKNQESPIEMLGEATEVFCGEIEL